MLTLSVSISSSPPAPAPSPGLLLAKTSSQELLSHTLRPQPQHPPPFPCSWPFHGRRGQQPRQVGAGQPPTKGPWGHGHPEATIQHQTGGFAPTGGTAPPAWFCQPCEVPC